MLVRCASRAAKRPLGGHARDMSTRLPLPRFMDPKVMAALDVLLRVTEGSNVGTRIREAGLLPAVIHARGDNLETKRLLIAVERQKIETELARLGDSFSNTCYDLTVNYNPDIPYVGHRGDFGKKGKGAAAAAAAAAAAEASFSEAAAAAAAADAFDVVQGHDVEAQDLDNNPGWCASDFPRVERCFPAQVIYHPVKWTPVCINFVRALHGRRVSVPLRFVNDESSIALKRGAFIVRLNRRVDVKADTADPLKIPKVLDVDLTNIKVGETVGLDRIMVPPGVELMEPKSRFLIGICKGKKETEEG